MSREMDALDDRRREADAPDSETDAPGMMKKTDEPGNIKRGMDIPDNIRQKLANVMFNGKALDCPASLPREWSRDMNDNDRSHGFVQGYGLTAPTFWLITFSAFEVFALIKPLYL